MRVLDSVGRPRCSPLGRACVRRMWRGGPRSWAFTGPEAGTVTVCRVRGTGRVRQLRNTFPGYSSLERGEDAAGAETARRFRHLTGPFLGLVANASLPVQLLPFAK